MMISAIVLSILQTTAVVEPLPVDEQMATYEATYPGIGAEVPADLYRLGPAEADWSTSGLSATSAIAARQGDAEQFVLGEWVKGGHGVSSPGDRPLRPPSDFRRYSVRDYEGAIDSHYYYRLAPGIVIHTFGSVRSVGNASCSRTQGIEMISRDRWQDWPEEIAVVAFGVVRLTRDDSRTYCTVYSPTRDGGFRQLAYTPEGQPFLVVNNDAQVFTITTRAEATRRMFATDTQPTPD